MVYSLYIVYYYVMLKQFNTDNYLQIYELRHVTAPTYTTDKTIIVSFCFVFIYLMS